MIYIFLSSRCCKFRIYNITAGYKEDYVIDNDLAGIIYWEITNDAEDAEYSIIDTVVKKFRNDDLIELVPVPDPAADIYELFSDGLADLNDFFGQF